MPQNQLYVSKVKVREPNKLRYHDDEIKKKIGNMAYDKIDLRLIYKNTIEFDNFEAAV